MRVASGCPTRTSLARTGRCLVPASSCGARGTTCKERSRRSSTWACPPSGRRRQPTRRPSISRRSPMTERVVIGRVGKPHGLDGSFYVEGPSQDERWWKVGARFLAAGSEVEVVGARRAQSRPVIKVEPPVARGATLEVERSALPPTDEDEYY